MRRMLLAILAAGLLACGDGTIDGASELDGPPGGAPDSSVDPLDDASPVIADAPPAPDAEAGTLLPAKFVGGYLEYWEGVLPRELPDSYTMLYHAFATVSSDGSIELPLTVDRDALATDVHVRRANGKLTILSIGGGGGAESGLNSQAEIDAFVSSVQPVIEEFEFAGIDWDLETGVPGGISVEGVVSASRRLKAAAGGELIITMAPYGSVASVYKEIATALGDDLSYVGYQFYNGDEAPTGDFIIGVMEDWMADCGLREDQFVIGFWYGPDDWLGLTTPYETMASDYEAVNAVHPGVRGVYTWAVAGTDMASGWQFVSTMAPIVL